MLAVLGTCDTGASVANPDGRADFTVDVGKLVGSGLGIVANSGAGKTGAIRKLLEQTHGQLQHIILDVEDDFYTLREKFPYLLAGGDNGDTPALPKHAKALADMLMANPGISAIIQLNDLPFDDQQEFILTFLRTMMGAPRDQWHPLLLVLDEAHRFAPQDGGSICGGAVHDLTARGRKRGFTAVLATQRMAKIDKNVTGDINNWLMGRVGQATDRRVAADALGFGGSSAEARGLMTMENRQFYAFGVALCPTPIKVTIGQTATTMMRAGETRAPTPPAPAAMKKMLAALAAAARETEAAEKAAAAASSAARSQTSGDSVEAPDGPTEADLHAIRTEAFAEGAATGIALCNRFWRPGVDAAIQSLDNLARMVGHTRMILQSAMDDQPDPDKFGNQERKEAPAAEPLEPIVNGPKRVLVPNDNKDNLNFSKTIIEGPADRPAAPKNMNGATRLLHAAGKLHPVKMTWGQLCATIQVKARGGNFNTNRRNVLEAGWLEEQGDKVVVTDKGLKEIGWKPSGKTLLEVMLEALPTGSARLLRTLEEHGGPMSPDHLAAAHGIQARGGNWNTAVSLLRSNDLIERLPNGDLVLAPSLRQ